MSAESVSKQKAPWHLWVVVVLTLLWNGLGAYTVMMAQAGKLAGMDAREAAYYAAKPLWFVITTDIALLLPVAAAIALLFRSRFAVWLFAAGLIVLVGNNAYDFFSGASLARGDKGWLVMTAIVVSIAVLQFWYSRAMTRRAVLS